MEAVAAVFLFATALLSVVEGSPVTLTLERAFPSNHGVELSQLRARDSLRHRRMLQSTNYVVDFPVKGTFDPSEVGLYYTKVKMGTPPREFYVQIDTGSDVLWIQLNYFDPRSSSTSSLISCSDRRCRNGVQSSDASCSSQNNQCIYTFQYGDGSGTSGYYVSDLMHFASIFEGTLTTNASASVVFGCSIQQTGDLTKSDRAVDGIFGFGQQGMSVISQLSSQGIAPRVFSHCLKGDNNGGGILVLGEIVEPNIVYTPLVPSQTMGWMECFQCSWVPALGKVPCVRSKNFHSGVTGWSSGPIYLVKMVVRSPNCFLGKYFRPHYNLYLQSISVNGQFLQINPAVFATSSNRGTIVDSGTTLSYLAEEAYTTFVNAITAAIPQSVRSVLSRGNQCYLITTSSNVDMFPQVSLNFAGGASLVLRPLDYLIQQNYIGEGSVWCIGFQKIPGQSVTILGGIVLVWKL
ncbi:hypothetical protein V8G54_024993 [Vigna mungo]|uniref:Peptidase A1 domain-containing protein n=1 Tax=Vigna mungo TaxID=3915 RepID=A0AAQ3RRU4_VIGMU